ncbi:hypothetical protein F5Y12DRAFT_716129 [Xylaria sp. FL1777]|nr:hypothetical protein F5Y12DRAFT_716129 [Xylaria sp. FL1777]
MDFISPPEGFVTITLTNPNSITSVPQPPQRHLPSEEQNATASRRAETIFVGLSVGALIAVVLFKMILVLGEMYSRYMRRQQRQQRRRRRWIDHEQGQGESSSSPSIALEEAL